MLTVLFFDNLVDLPSSCQKYFLDQLCPLGGKKSQSKMLSGGRTFKGLTDLNAGVD